LTKFSYSSGANAMHGSLTTAKVVRYISLFVLARIKDQICDCCRRPRPLSVRWTYLEN